MNKKMIDRIFCLLCLLMAAPVRGEEEVRPPKKIEHDGKIFVYNPAFEADETTLTANLDDDPEGELILAFVSTYKEEKDMDEDEKPSLMPPAAARPEDLSLIRHNAFYQIYDIKEDGRFHLAKTISGMDAMGKIRVLALEENTPPIIAFLSPGGERYIDVSLYQWQEGGYRLIFNEGGSDGASINEGPPPEIHIGKKAAGTDPAAGDIFAWNSVLKKFQLKKYSAGI